MPGRKASVVFYLPCSEADFNRLPQRLVDYADWQASETSVDPFLGRIHWVLQTFLHLKSAGYPVDLSPVFPDHGVVVSHVDDVAYDFVVPRLASLVALLVDKDVPLPQALIHVTHNPVQALPLGLRFQHLPPWTQTGLIPRRTDRGKVFERVGFIGHVANLHPAFRAESFCDELASMGLTLEIPTPKSWHDFGTLDAILAVRGFGTREPHLSKPALKLLNAWRAEVPAIIGFESACRATGSPGVDYLEAVSEEAVLESLRRLAAEPALRERLVANGRQRASAFSEANLTERWAQFLFGQVSALHQTALASRVFRARRWAARQVQERLLWRKPGWYRQSNPG